MMRKKDSSNEDSTDAFEEKVERLEKLDVYPFALVLRLRVGQIVCGITTLLMGSVALIEEKSGEFSLAMGIPTGTITILAAGYGIYCSRGFDGYQPCSCKASSPWSKFRFLGPTCKIATIYLVLWSLTSGLLFALSFNAVHTIATADENTSLMMDIVAAIQLMLSAAVTCALFTTVWVDLNHDPD